MSLHKFYQTSRLGLDPPARSFSIGCDVCNGTDGVRWPTPKKARYAAQRAGFRAASPRVPGVLGLVRSIDQCPRCHDAGVQAQIDQMMGVRRQLDSV